MLSDCLNCAVIGLGVGEHHVRTLLDHPRAHLLGICDLNQEKTSEILKKFQLEKKLVKSFEEILNDSYINFVSIASFDDVHFEQVMACLKHGKHVFVEKPLCQTQKQLMQIYRLWKKNNLALSSNLVLRKSPLYSWLGDIISAGKLGDIYAVDMDYLYGRIYKITEGWRSSVIDYSVMAGGGIHLVDLMMKLTRKKPILVQSCSNKIATKNTLFKYHDFHASTFYFSDGVIARITANFACVHKHQHSVRVFGTKATFFHDDCGARIHWSRDENSLAELIDIPSKIMDKGCLLSTFIDNILKGEFKDQTMKEFDLMCAVSAADQAIYKNQHPINIQYYS